MVIGGDPYDADSAYLRAVTDSPEVEHHPWMDNVTGVMRHLDVLVLPSRQEPFGTVLAEAMSVAARSAARRFGADDYADRVERLLIAGTW